MVLTMDLTTSRGKALASNSSAREPMGVQEVMLYEYKQAKRAKICVELVCIMLSMTLVRVKM